MKAAYKFFIPILFALISCVNRTDVQPPHQEVVAVTVTDGVIDSLVVVTIDTVMFSPGNPDTVVYSDTVKIEKVPVPVANPAVVPPSSPKVTYTISYPDLLDSLYMSQVGVRELTGNNDGPDVLKYQKNAGLTSGYSWCACFVKWCFDQAGVRTPITAWSPTCHNKKNIVMMNSTYKKELQKGDVFTLYFPRMKRIGHTGFVRRKFGMNSVETVEGNTNSAGSREGDGVYIKVRPKSSIYSITRWL